MIPSIGRVVLYFPLPNEMDHEHVQPFPALVSHLHNPEGTLIALGGFTDTGSVFANPKVTFVDGTACAPGQACWMPYQVKVAAEAAEREAQITTGKTASGLPSGLAKS